MKVRRIVSLLGHQVRVQLANGSNILLHPSGTRARRDENVIDLGNIDFELGKIPVIAKTMGAISGLPDPVEGTIYVVSLHVAQRAWKEGRLDVVALGNLVKDRNTARTIACRSLSLNPTMTREDVRCQGSTE